MCKFITLDGSKYFSTRIISYDSKFVYCYTPAAYLIDPGMLTNGGIVNVRISSNNRDYSDELYTFKYDPIANIESLSPLWVIKDSN